MFLTLGSHTFKMLTRNATRGRAAAMVRGLAVAACAVIGLLPARAQDARWAQLRHQAVAFESQANYAAAIPLEQQAAQVAQATWGPRDLHLAVTLNALGIAEQHVQKFSDAETNLKRAIELFTAIEGAQGKEVAIALNNLGTLYEDTARYPDAEKALQQALQIHQRLLGENDPGVAIDESNLALIYEDEEKYDDAEALYRKALAIDERSGNAAQIGADMAGLVKLYLETGKNAQAEQAAQQELAADLKAYGPQDPRVAFALCDLGVDLGAEGKQAEAEQAFAKALALEQKAASPDLAEIAQIEENMGALYRDAGKYQQAELLMLQALESRTKALGPSHPLVASALSSLGVLYEDEMRFSDAERAMRQALDIDAKALGAGSAQTARDMRDLAHLYGSHGQPGPAERLYYNAIQIYLKVPGLSGTAMAGMTYEGATQFLNDGKLEIAARLFNDAGAMYHNAEGDSSLGAARCLAQLGAIAEDVGKREDAESLLKKALAAFEKVSGPDSPELVDPLGGLARVYKTEKRFADAEPLYLQALKIEQAHSRPNDSVTVALELNLAALYYAWGKPAQAAPYFRSFLGSLMDEFRANAATMSERERLAFLSSQQLAFPLFFSFAAKYHGQIPGLAGQMYDMLLEEKGLIASSSASMRAAVEASGDPQAVAMLDKMGNDRARMAVLMESTAGDAATRKAQINQLGDEANTLEQTLMKRSAALNQKMAQTRATWQEVQKALKPGESAVEVVRFPYDAGFGPTDLGYVALIVTPESKEPEVVILGAAKQLEASPMLAYRANVAQTRGVQAEETPATPGQQAGAANTSAAYAAFWKPMEAALGGAKRVYLSPDGVLNTVPMGLMAESDGKLLMEKVQLRIVNSTRDLLLPVRAASAKSALLVGNPKFDVSATEQKTAMAELRRVATRAGTDAGHGLPAPDAAAAQVQTASRGGDLKGGDLNPLPGTQVEVDTVDKLLKASGWQATEYTGELALKDVVTEAHSPRVVHIATHGFFLSDEDLKANLAANVGEDPMLRSGLFFAGADRARQGAAPEAGVDDGVLTAFEASQLNLEGTELVVLSACETGLGQQSNSEGVFGLRRGLQEAGADAVLMSMWSVPDKETQELMSLFYAKWLGGLDKPEALRQAQLQERETVRQRYGKDLPFYWGAFVMVSR